MWGATEGKEQRSVEVARREKGSRSVGKCRKSQDECRRNAEDAWRKKEGFGEDGAGRMEERLAEGWEKGLSSV